ncbi:MAG: 4-(cytidine 5'-diphospho)-2-C-methyl-D-erythritol kinase [Kiritimatiellae bacterium]|nr:4-(cytidine 5'-diphospho)-2-C-methyl-D-erythritol kinase [Kiritimatiellia bacterium]
MKLAAYAKVNLFLEVLGKRPDGYHALRSLVLPVSLADDVEALPSEDGSISSDAPFADDLCVKAACALAAATGCKRGARISVTKRIPVGGGLGGGRADAAATLRALNTLWELQLPPERLCEIAASVGSDVPALLLGGPVLMEGRGEIVSRFGSVPPLHLVLANPGVFSSTKLVYGALAENLSSPSASDRKICYNMRTALERGNLADIAAAAVNDLASPAMALYPEIADAAAALRSAGAVGVTVSGSGSTVFGLVPDQARGRETAAQLEAKGLKAWSVSSVCPVM